MALDCTAKLPEYPDWMSKLGPDAVNLPLNRIAIPGSHDSLSNKLDIKGPPAPECPAVIRVLCRIFGARAKRIVERWSKTQSLTLSQQLHAGIRYFDLRISTKPGTKNLYIVHGLYSSCVEEEMKIMSSFLKEHPKEILLLDFNHFYNMTDSNHAELCGQIREEFGDKISGYCDIAEVTLQNLWDRGKQVLVFYHYDGPIGIGNFWPGNTIPSPWPNTTSRATLLKFLRTNLAERPSNSFYVTQGVLTPDVVYVLKYAFRSLQGQLASKVAPEMVKWLSNETPGNPGINVCILDFVEMANYIETVINLNNSIRGSPTKSQ